MVDNQHRKITGYRDLTEQEIAAMNGLKQTERDVLAGLDQVGATPNVDKRWLAIARTHIEQGFMAAVRSIARPNEA